jgi:hypothetical protein
VVGQQTTLCIKSSKMNAYPVTNVFVADRLNPIYASSFPANYRRFIVYTHTLMDGACYVTSRSVDTMQHAERYRRTLLERLSSPVHRDTFLLLLQKMAAQKRYHILMDVIRSPGAARVAQPHDDELLWDAATFVPQAAANIALEMLSTMHARC